MRAPRLLPLPALPLPVLMLVALCRGELAMLGPSLLHEPAARVQFAAARGVTLPCVARGTPPPAVTWLADDGAALHDLPHVRRIHSNGTLEILPSPRAFEPPPTTVRCRAANAHGVTLSRDVALLPVADGAWDVVASAPAAALGGVAAVTCAATRHAALVRPALWYRGDSVLQLDAPGPGARLLVAGDTLLLRAVRAADAGAYSCLARHRLTAATRRAAPALLAVGPGTANSAPRLVTAGGELEVSAGHDVCLPCVATDVERPHYTWYRSLDGRLEPVAPGPDAWLWGGGAALCLRRVAGAVAGQWVCRASTAHGDATAHLTLAVLDALSVTVTPTVLVAAGGSTARFTCAASLAGAALAWLHDGVAAGAGAELRLRGVARAHRGVYQCVARAGADSAQASAELRLGEAAPELHYTFIEQALRPGGAVALRCAAWGAPPPRFAWLLDDQPLDAFRAQHRYSVSAETSLAGDVVSVLNMSAVTPADGGRYTCRAANERGRAEHSARLNIYGPPSIRALGPVRVVAGANATIYCPYAGYPISSVSWWRRGAGALGGAGRVSARGAALRLAPALAADAGAYTCAVAAPHGPAARRDVDVQVRNPPKISPFMFSSELTEGSSVQVLCGVSSGDKPVYFAWLKDDAPIPTDLQIEEKSLNEFSLLMFPELSARHSGAYTCHVSNHAAAVNYTAHLSVKVAPTWMTEPVDAAVLLGAPLRLECAAKGHPAPTITWYRRIGAGGEGEEQWQAAVGEAAGEAAGEAGAGGALAWRAAARALAGAYRCAADNGVGPPLLKLVNVTVHEPAHFEGGGANVSAVRGRGAALSCAARGDGPLDVRWSHAGARLDLASYRWTVTEERAGGGLRSTLRLRAAERADAGEYRCHAHNQYGRSEQRLYLRVDEPPEAPRRLQLAGVGSRWVRVAWSAPRAADAYSALYAPPAPDARPTVVNLTVDTAGDDGIDADGWRTLRARLDGLRPASAYSLRLAASNYVGQSSHSEPLLFTTLEEAPSASPQNVRVRAANTGELHVSWSVPPKDSWNSELLGYVVSWRELSWLDEDDSEDGATPEERAGSETAPGWASAELTLAGLRSSARYALAVRAYNRAGAGPASPAAYASTADGAPERAPRGVACEPLSPRSLRVRWAPLGAPHAQAYELHYAPVHLAESAGALAARAGPAGEATLQGLRAATNYSVSVRARAAAGLGPPSPPVYCTTADDVPEAVAAVRALGCAPNGVRVTWLAPDAPRLTHYTLYTRELGKVGGEWAQRVDAAEMGDAGEVWREVRGLRERTVYEFWVRAASPAGAGPPSRAVTAAPAAPGAARITSFARVVWAARGSRVRLRCRAVGAPPLRWRWRPLPAAHAVTDAGDLIIHKVEAEASGNYTCEVRNGGGSDALVVALRVRLPPAAPTLRLLRAERTALLLAWDEPAAAPLAWDAPAAAPLGYTLAWARAAPPGRERERRLPAGDSSLLLRGLACGAPYRVSLRAHNAAGASPASAPLLARTRGDKAQAPPGAALVWANSTALRLNLLAWRARCPVAWRVALRPPGGAWRDVPSGAEAAEAGDLQPGSWYEIRVVAHSAAGDTVALYKAATHTSNGERLGDAVDLPGEAAGAGAGAEGGAAAGPGAAWRALLAPALLGGGLALLLAALTGAAACRRAARGARPPPRAPHAQLYSTEPGKRNGKTLTPPDGAVTDELHEISPYATFSMAGAGAEGAGGAGGAARGCALHLRTFARADALALAAPPPRPSLTAQHGDYGRGRDSDSESSGSPCAACAAELYRLPAAHLSDTLRAAEASGAERPAARARRRRELARHAGQPSTRYLGAGGAGGVARRDQLA